MSKLFKSKILSNKKVQLAVAAVLSFVLLLICFNDNNHALTKSESKEALESDITTSEDYEINVENRIVSIVNSINGISDAKVFVYTKSSIEIIYAEDKEVKTSGGENGSSTELESIVFSKDGTKTSAVVIKKNYPKIEGVLVVAKGANDEKKRIMIINALATVLDINITDVEVLAG
jgi:stage III sporulation protein AG